MKATWNGAIIAESDDTVVVEGNHYFPPASLDRQYVRESSTPTVCPWKGTAGYFDVVVGRRRPTRMRPGSTPSPKDAAAEIKDHVAFWKGVEVSE